MTQEWWTFFSVVVAIASVSFVCTVRYTRGILPNGQASDATKQIRAAAQSKNWRWPSDMHNFIDCKARMKDVAVLLLALFQLLMNDRDSFHPLIASCAFANAVSIILIFLVGDMYFGTVAGFILALLFSTSFWSYQVVLFGAYQITALPFLLLSCLFVEHAGSSVGATHYLLTALSGASFAAMMFTSASARKWLPLVIFAFLYGHRGLLRPPQGLEVIANVVLSSPSLLAMTFVSILTFLLWALIALFSERIVCALHDGRVGGALSGALMKARTTTPIDIYHSRMKRVVSKLFLFSLGVISLPLLCVGFSTDPSFHNASLSFLTGASLIVYALNAPRLMENLREFFNYWIIASATSTFPLYEGIFKRLGVPMPKRVSSGGWIWYPRFLFRFVPFHLMAAVTALAYVGVTTALGDAPANGAMMTGLILLLAISPIIWGQITDSPQFSRTYYPILIGLLIPVGVAISTLEKAVPFYVFWPGASLFLFISGAWNLYVLVTDIWPSRMAAQRVMRALEAATEKKIATYPTAYNNNLADCLPPTLRERIRPISSLSEVHNGLVLVPGITEFAVNLEGERDVLKRGDFREDRLLNELIDSGRIADAAVDSFKTLGTSPYWSQDNQILSYLELIHRCIGPAERQRGRAWLIDAVRAHQVLNELGHQTAVNT